MIMPRMTRGFAILAAVTIVFACAASGGAANVTPPHGTVAYFLHGSKNLYLGLAPLEGGATRLVRLPSGGPEALEFSSDGSTVSFLVRPGGARLHRGTYYVVDTASLRVRRVLSSQKLGPGIMAVSRAPTNRVAVVHKVFSPHSSCRGRSWISIVDEGGATHRLPDLPLAARQTASRTVFIDEISWSADGRSVAVTVKRFDDPGDCRLNEYGSSSLFRLPASGRGKALQLRHSALFLGVASWSSDARAIAYVEWHLDQANLFVVRPNGEGRQALTHFGRSDEPFLSYVWSGPTSIVAVHEPHDQSQSARLYKIDVAQASSTEVAVLSESRGVYAANRDVTVVATSASELLTISLADGATRGHTRLMSPRTGLQLDDYDPVAVSLAR